MRAGSFSYTEHCVATLCPTGWVSGNWLERERAEQTSGPIKAKDLEPREQVRAECRDGGFPARRPPRSHGGKGEARSPAAEDRWTEASPVFRGVGTRNRAHEPIQEDSKLVDYGLSSGAEADTKF